MAQGTVKWFAQGLHDLGNKIHDLDADDFPEVFGDMVEDA